MSKTCGKCGGSDFTDGGNAVGPIGSLPEKTRGPVRVVVFQKMLHTGDSIFAKKSDSDRHGDQAQPN